MHGKFFLYSNHLRYIIWHVPYYIALCSLNWWLQQGRRNGSRSSATCAWCRWAGSSRPCCTRQLPNWTARCAWYISLGVMKHFLAWLTCLFYFINWCWYILLQLKSQGKITKIAEIVILYIIYFAQVNYVFLTAMYYCDIQLFSVQLIVNFMSWDCSFFIIGNRPHNLRWHMNLFSCTRFFTLI
jgi:hypothetical protein